MAHFVFSVAFGFGFFKKLKAVEPAPVIAKTPAKKRVRKPKVTNIPVTGPVSRRKLVTVKVK